METYHYYHPIEVRYGDLDPQGHLNNAKYLTYMEQARIHYLQHLGLWDGKSFLDVGIILANVQVTFHTAIQFSHQVRVGVRVTRLGHKSLEMTYRLEEAQTSQEFASGTTVLVAYDYRSFQTIPIPQNWREKIEDFEKLTQL